MKLRILGASGAEFPGQNPPGFLLDDSVLLDAGTIGAVLDEKEQYAIRHILLTHAHLDHIRGIPSLADNIILKNKDHTVIIHGIESVLFALMDNLLNDVVWPDFTKIPSEDDPVLRVSPITVGKPFRVNSYSVTAYTVNHSVPAVGFVVENSEGRRLLYTGDTGPTDEIWEATNKTIHAAIIEVSMPDSMEEMAIMTGHLTARLLGIEISKMKNIPEKIYITHPKPQYIDTIMGEIAALGLDHVSLLEGGEVLEI